ncbi:ELMO/CED-12 family protein [Xylariaceae sp. FL0804]|nr:ELMO/CED-12 family protein [Xylariaceae sp. FL0804]
MDQADIPGLLSRLASDEDASRKMAVFKLQSSINDPSFADVFISSGGLVVLRRLIMSSGGNTLAYSLQSLSRLLEVDMGWDIFEGPTAGDLVERVVELIVTNPLVNILRGAMSILVALVSHSQSETPVSPAPTAPGSFGFRALKPAVAVYPQFFDLVIQKLQSADHALCATTLMLINALIRDAVSNDPAASKNDRTHSAGEEWPKFIRKLQDLGLIKAVYVLMQSAALQDLAHPLLEFQALTKVLLKKWRDVRVDVERPDHRRALKGIHLASAPTKDYLNGHTSDRENIEEVAEAGRKGSRRHNPMKWRRLGFEGENPAHEFEAAGFLGLMDLTDYVRKNEDGFQKLLLEQSTKPLQARCPVARASMAVTLTLYEHFDCENTDIGDVRGFQLSDRKQQDKLFRPMLLQWSRLHTAGLQAFFRLWRTTGAELDDFAKVVELVRILVDQVVGRAGRAKDVAELEEELVEYDLARLRDLQMDVLTFSFENQWGRHLTRVRDSLNQEALAFVKEQRVRCLLQGSWFSKGTPRNDGRADEAPQTQRAAPGTMWRYAKLSHNRRYLHWADFALRTAQDPGLDALGEKADLRTISSVVSNVSAPSSGGGGDDANKSEEETTTTSASTSNKQHHHHHSTKITIFSFANPAEARKGPSGGREQPLLTLYPPSHSLASEWLDGLLMLLDQAPITAETNKMVGMVKDYGLKIRLLNVQMEATYMGPPEGAGQVPSREGLNDDYHYAI